MTNAGAAFLVRTLECDARPAARRTACERNALDQYSQAISRETSPELTERGCPFSVRPNQSVLPRVMRPKHVESRHDAQS